MDVLPRQPSEGEINWLVIAAGSGYEPAFDRIRSFLGEVGRMKYLKPLYTALTGHPDTRGFAYSTRIPTP